MVNQPSSDFEKAVSDRADGSLFGDFWYQLRHTRKWWLVPLAILMLVFGALIFLGGTAAAPFIYTLF